MLDKLRGEIEQLAGPAAAEWGEQRKQAAEHGPHSTPPETFGERATRELNCLQRIIEGLEHLSHAAANEDNTDSTITFEILEREANSALTIISEIGDELRARLERES